MCSAWCYNNIVTIHHPNHAFTPPFHFTTNPTAFCDIGYSDSLPIVTLLKNLESFDSKIRLLIVTYDCLQRHFQLAHEGNDCFDTALLAH